MFYLLIILIAYRRLGIFEVISFSSPLRPIEVQLQLVISAYLVIKCRPLLALNVPKFRHYLKTLSRLDACTMKLFLLK